jgi:hypothetical protein
VDTARIHYTADGHSNYNQIQTRNFRISTRNE